jgi:hypothetical protein
MIFVKSLLVGLVAALLAETFLLVGGIAAIAVLSHPGMESPAIDPISVVKSSPALWALALVAFAVGFLWEYRRAKRPLTK